MHRDGGCSLNRWVITLFLTSLPLVFPLNIHNNFSIILSISYSTPAFPLRHSLLNPIVIYAVVSSSCVAHWRVSSVESLSMFYSRATAKSFAFDSLRNNWSSWIKFSGSLCLFWITIRQTSFQWTQIYLFCMVYSLQSCLLKRIYISNLTWSSQIQWKWMRIHLVHSLVTHPAACTELLKQRWYLNLTVASFRPPGKTSLFSLHLYWIVTWMPLGSVHICGFI